MGRRSPLPPRPFFGQSAPAPAVQQQAAVVEQQAAVVEEPAVVEQQAPVIVAAPPMPEPAPPAPAPAGMDQEAWKSYLGLASLPSRVSEPLPEIPAIEPRREMTPAGFQAVTPTVESPSEQPITVEVPIYEDGLSAAVYDAQEAQHRPRVVTRELPALSEDTPNEVAAMPPTVSSEPETDLLEASRFVTAASEPTPADNLIDEVDAAFISSGLPTSTDPASDAAKQAAATLESIAQRLRSGQIELRAGVQKSSDESVLATVLAALLANR